MEVMLNRPVTCSPFPEFLCSNSLLCKIQSLYPEISMDNSERATNTYLFEKKKIIRIIEHRLSKAATRGVL